MPFPPRPFWLLAAVLALTSPVPYAHSQSAFAPGEKLDFVLKWNGIAAGDSTMSVEKMPPSGGKSLFRIVSTAKSRSLIDIIYPVRNRYESHFDPVSGLPQKYIARMREGGKRSDRVLIFDQKRHIVTRIEKKDGRTKSRIYKILPSTQDTLSSLYVMRNETLRVGDRVGFRVFESRKNYELIVEVLGKEEIKVAAGRFQTLKIHPILKYEGIFRRKGDLFIWITDDSRHIPVLMKSKIAVGSISAELAGYTYGDEADDSPKNEVTR
ncbi:MAG: DUF3108 domain-containing protein [Deltaproteobacteria bacterium]|nr:DUF3108 domain-containing protein [Deltaproteobacteria bacterium]